MITNALLQRLDIQTGISSSGEEIFTPGSAVAVGCFLDGVTERQRRDLGATIADAEAVCYLDKSDAATGLPGASVPPFSRSDRIMVCLEGESAAKLWQIQSAGDRVLNTLSHYELFLKPV